MGWRNQILLLLDLGYRVVCPDMIGYGGTVCAKAAPSGRNELNLCKDAPQVPPYSIDFYTFKRSADDMVELARQIGVTQVILGGHDWYAKWINAHRCDPLKSLGAAPSYTALRFGILTSSRTSSPSVHLTGPLPRATCP